MESSTSSGGPPSPPPGLDLPMSLAQTIHFTVVSHLPGPPSAVVAGLDPPTRESTTTALRTAFGNGARPVSSAAVSHGFVFSAYPFALRLAVNSPRRATPVSRAFHAAPPAVGGGHVVLTAAYVNGAATTSPVAATAAGGASTASYVIDFPGFACRRHDHPRCYRCRRPTAPSTGGFLLTPRRSLRSKCHSRRPDRRS